MASRWIKEWARERKQKVVDRNKAVWLGGNLGHQRWRSSILSPVP
jgi:hypothetical protein